MTDTKDFLNDIWKSALEKWGNKTWFQVFFLFYAIVVPLFLGGYIIYRDYYNSSQEEVITTVLDERDETKKEQHKASFNEARQRYTDAKKILKTYLEPTRSDYIFYIEYHNGTENVSSEVPFCKFDVTLEVANLEKQYVPLNKFKDDIVSRYDILELNYDSDAHLYTIEQIKTLDRYFYYQLQYIDATNVAMVNLFNGGYDEIMGTLIFVSVNGNTLVSNKIYKCARDMENVFKNDI